MLKYIFKMWNMRCWQLQLQFCWWLWLILWCCQYTRLHNEDGRV